MTATHRNTLCVVSTAIPTLPAMVLLLPCYDKRSNIPELSVVVLDLAYKGNMSLLAFSCKCDRAAPAKVM